MHLDVYKGAPTAEGPGGVALSFSSPPQSEPPAGAATPRIPDTEHFCAHCHASGALFPGQTFAQPRGRTRPRAHHGLESRAMRPLQAPRRPAQRSLAAPRPTRLTCRALGTPQPPALQRTPPRGLRAGSRCPRILETPLRRLPDLATRPASCSYVPRPRATGALRSRVNSLPQLSGKGETVA